MMGAYVRVRWGMLTRYEDVLVRRPDELHRPLGEQRHVLVNGVVDDVSVRGVVQSDEDVQEH